MRKQNVFPVLGKCPKSDWMMYWKVVLVGGLTDDEFKALQGRYSRRWFTSFSQRIRSRPITDNKMELGVTDKAISQVLGSGRLSDWTSRAISQKFLDIEAVQFEKFSERWRQLSVAEKMVTEVTD